MLVLFPPFLDSFIAFVDILLISSRIILTTLKRLLFLNFYLNFDLNFSLIFNFNLNSLSIFFLNNDRNFRLHKIINTWYVFSLIKQIKGRYLHKHIQIKFKYNTKILFSWYSVCSLWQFRALK
jgi:hypothetical protein